MKHHTTCILCVLKGKQHSIAAVQILLQFYTLRLNDLWRIVLSICFLVCLLSTLTSELKSDRFLIFGMLTHLMMPFQIHQGQ